MSSLEIRQYYHYTFEEGYVFTGHTHVDFEANLVLRGNMDITIGDQLFKAGAGELYLTAPGVYHHNRLVGESAEMIVVHFSGEDIDFEVSAARRLDGDESALATLMYKLFDSMIKSGWRYSDGKPRHFENPQKLFEVLVSLTVSSEPNITRHSSRRAELYAEALALMSERICDKLTIADIAAELHVAPTLVKSAFAEIAGKGAIEFFTEMKIAAARKMLVAGKSITYVSDYLGFSSQSYFSTVFKRVTGMTPNKIRG